MSEDISAAEATRQFSRLLRGVREQGATYIVTSHGKPVAKIVPVDGCDEVRVGDAERRRIALEVVGRLPPGAAVLPVQVLGEGRISPGGAGGTYGRQVVSGGRLPSRVCGGRSQARHKPRYAK
jgi:prevent-host-death family protein